MSYPGLLHPELLPLLQSTADMYLLRRHSNIVLSQSLWDLWVLVWRFVCAFWVSLSGMGFDSKCEFIPPTILLGHLLCPWNWGVLIGTPAPTALLGFLWPWTWDISSQLLHHQAAATVILDPDKIKSATASNFSPSIFHEVMGMDTIVLVVLMLSFKPTFSLSSFTLIKRLFSSPSLSTTEVVLFPYLRYWHFSQQSWFQLVVHPAQHFEWCILHKI